MKVHFKNSRPKARQRVSTNSPTYKNVLFFSLAGLTTAGLTIFAETSSNDASRWPRIESSIQRDEALEQKVDLLMHRMTLTQKIGQMVQAEISEVTPADVREYGLGSVLNGGGSFPNGNKHATPADWLAQIDRLWLASMEETPTKPAIPLMWGTDAVHGHNNVMGATLFPHNIGLGAAVNPELMQKIAEATALEVAATGADWTFAPTLAAARDDRWGRTYESYSESPAVIYDYAIAMVRGLQGNFSDNNILATAKHFIGDGGTDRGIDRGNTLASEEELIRFHAAGYFGAIKAGTQIIMASYSSWQGLKMHAHRYLLTDVLKNRIGFDGFVISDYDAIAEVPGCKLYDCPEAVNAGIDMFMIAHRADWIRFISLTRQEVESGVIPLARIDDAVRRILRVKLRAGLFEKPLPSQRPNARRPELIGAAAHRVLAQQAVRESLVLLKNNNGVLPLNHGQRIVVAGKAANSIPMQAGGWSLTWQGTENRNEDFPGATTILDGIKRQSTHVTYAADGRAPDAKQFDVAIAVIGERPYAEGQGDLGRGKTFEHALNYPADLAMLKNLEKLGIPVVTILVSGRPLYVNKELNLSDAFIAAFLPGSEGSAVADVLFQNGGDMPRFDFRGRLSFSWPASPCQAPCNLNETQCLPLFNFGYGLSYQNSGEVGRLQEESMPQGCGF
jgi:beta-glucosidase